MTIPANVKTYEHSIATLWFGDLGILYSISRPGPRTIEVMDDYILFIRSIIGAQPVCILTDISKASPMDKKARDHTATQLQKVYKAMAIISNTAVGDMVGKVFLQLDVQPYPTAMFTTEADAKEWLMQYL
jgi:hypothetical protein